MQAKKLMLASAAMLGLLASAAALSQNTGTRTIDTRIGKIELLMGLPANAQVEQKIYHELDFQRASQATSGPCRSWP